MFDTTLREFSNEIIRGRQSRLVQVDLAQGALHVAQTRSAVPG